jgi:predicted small secreted protein
VIRSDAMKRILTLILGGVLTAVLSSCSGTVAGTPRDIDWSPSGEVHQYGPGGSLADKDLSQYDFDTGAKIDAMR